MRRKTHRFNKTYLGVLKAAGERRRKLLKKLFIIFLLVNSVRIFGLDLKIEGNTRSKEKFIKSLYYRCRDVQGFKENRDIVGCMMNSRLFSKVEISNTESHKIISVSDRWTLLPIPFARSDRGEKKAGIYVLEQNFLGYGKLALMGFISGERSDSFFVMYRDPFFLDSTYQMATSLSRGDTALYRYHKKKELSAHRIDQERFKIEGGYQTGPTNYNLGLIWMKRKYKTIDNYQFEADDNRSLRLNSTISYINSRYKFYFQEGTSLFVDFETELEQQGEGKKSTRVNFKYNYQNNLMKDQVLQFSFAGGTVQNQGAEDILYIGGSNGFRGVTQGGIWSKSNKSFSIDYQIPLLDKGYGTWTVGPYADYAWYQNFDEPSSWKNSYGVGVGGYLFLKKIAMPGMGILIGYNPEFEQVYTTFSLGMSI